MTSVLEGLFEFLFKYRPVVFEKGELGFDGSRFGLLAALAGAALIALAILTYVGVRAQAATRDRIVLGVMRAAALALVVLCLTRPVMVLAAAVAQRNVVGILLDDSRSMQIADVSGKARSAFVRQQFGARDSALVAALSQRFLLRFFRFSKAADRITEVSDLSFTGAGTRVAPSLERARQELAGVPLSGLVLVTDGADNSTGAIADQLQSLSAWSVPVFTVGVGKEHFPKDIQVDRVEVPRSTLKGSLLAVDVVITQTGFAGAKVPLVVEDSGRIVATQDVTLPSSGEAAVVRVNVPTNDAGTRLFTFRVPLQDGEVVTRNNARSAIVRVRDRTERILYIEGQPRFEMKFLRHAVAADSNIQVVTLQRTADGKFLRLSVRDSAELANGFPAKREELFAYRAVILGNIEASYFTLDQLRMLADFVSERGGTLLTLGGRAALAEGGYADTPLVDVFPVTLDASAASNKEPYFSELKVEPTQAGALHPVTQVAGSAEKSAERWKTLPPLSTVNRIGRAKPGAVTLLNGTAKGKGPAKEQIVLAYQRYGRGLSIVLPVQDTWLWQMHADIPADDMTHETFWRQMLRWLVSDVPDQVTATASVDRVEPGDAVTLRAEVRDTKYAKANGAKVVAHVTAPGGAVKDVPMEWATDGDGEYRATLTPDAKGMYAVRVEAHAADGTALPDGAAVVEAADLDAEYFDAAMRAPLLKRIARETGGRFYTPETVASLPKDIVYTKSGATALERLDLWDMPVVFLMLLGLVAGEWGYRKARGLA